MLLGLKASELGGGKIRPPQVLSVFKSPSKIGLNLTTFYPPELLPKSTLIVSSFYHQSPVIAYLIPQKNQGVFKIQCKNEDDYNKPRIFKLKITDEKTKTITGIPLEEPNRHLPKGNPNFENGTLITIQGACENGMEKESNEETDKFFCQF